MYQYCTVAPVRRYYNRAERRAWLEAYANQLENELQGVRERIHALADHPPSQPHEGQPATPSQTNQPAAA